MTRGRKNVWARCKKQLRQTHAQRSRALSSEWAGKLCGAALSHRSRAMRPSSRSGCCASDETLKVRGPEHASDLSFLYCEYVPLKRQKSPKILELHRSYPQFRWFVFSLCRYVVSEKQQTFFYVQTGLMQKKECPVSQAYHTYYSTGSLLRKLR